MWIVVAQACASTKEGVASVENAEARVFVSMVDERIFASHAVEKAFANTAASAGHVKLARIVNRKAL